MKSTSLRTFARKIGFPWEEFEQLHTRDVLEMMLHYDCHLTMTDPKGRLPTICITCWIDPKQRKHKCGGAP